MPRRQARSMAITTQLRKKQGAAGAPKMRIIIWRCMPAVTAARSGHPPFALRATQALP